MDCDTLASRPFLTLEGLSKEKACLTVGCLKARTTLTCRMNKTTQDSICWNIRVNKLWVCKNRNFCMACTSTLGSITPFTRKRADTVLHRVACSVMDMGDMKHYGKWLLTPQARAQGSGRENPLMVFTWRQPPCREHLFTVTVISSLHWNLANVHTSKASGIIWQTVNKYIFYK